MDKTDNRLYREAEAAFEKWSAQHDNNSDEYLDMGADAFFVAGYLAALSASQPKALTDDQIMQIWFDDKGHSSMEDALISFARALLEASK